jgi:hypothetical protein
MRATRARLYNVYPASLIVVLIPVRCIQVMGLELEALRQGTRSADSRAQRLAVTVPSLQEICAEMPTMDDEWEV